MGDDSLEFNVTEPSEQYEGGLLRATNITAPSGKPILCELGPLGKYLQSKMNLAIYQNELDEYDMSSYSKGSVLNGFITNYSTHHKFGQIEIESSDLDKRYRRCYFKLDDVVMPSGDFDLDRIFIRDGSKVQFELDAIDYDTEFQDVEPNVHIKAINLVSEGLDFLEMTENTFSEIRNLDTPSDGQSTTQNNTFTQNQFKLELDDDTNKDNTVMNEDEDDQPLFADDDEEEELK